MNVSANCVADGHGWTVGEIVCCSLVVLSLCVADVLGDITLAYLEIEYNFLL